MNINQPSPLFVKHVQFSLGISHKDAEQTVNKLVEQLAKGHYTWADAVNAYGGELGLLNLIGKIKQGFPTARATIGKPPTKH